MDELVLTRKIKLWENRLLDLSKRNRMISFKDTSSQVIRFTDPGFEELYQALVVNGHSMQIKRPIDRNTDPAIYAILRLMRQLSEPLEVGQGQIRTSGTLENSARTVRNIKKYADLSLQEKGTNVLYLSFGFLYWKDRDTKGIWLKAPLVLIPASLTQTAVNQPYAVQKTEEEIIVNPTFAYYLEVNHGIRLPALKSTNKFSDIVTFLEQTAAAVEKLGWRVEREVYLSTMSFLKTNMYNDLVANEEKIGAHPVIRAFAGEQNASTTLAEADTDFKHDATNVESVFEVLNADSSQKDAVELSRSGISFVMQGPPGTGKSQTIANIIAQGIGEGKKILFVSEKQAALDVVYRRLRDVGLSALCLPLHDPKTSRQTVLKEFEKNLDASQTQIGNDRLAELHQLNRLREELNTYSQYLHEKIQPLNMSLYEAYQMLFELADTEDVIAALPDLASVNRAEMNRMIRDVSEYEAMRCALGESWYAHPWLGIKKRNLSNVGKQRLKESMESLLQILEAFCTFEITGGKCLADIITLNNRQEYESVGRLIARDSVVPASMVLNPDPESQQGEIQSVMVDLTAFYGKTEQQILKNLDALKAHSLSTAKLFEELSAVLEKMENRDAKISYQDLFKLQVLMHQCGLDTRTLSVTERYFEPNGLSEIERIKMTQLVAFNRADRIHMRLRKRYKDDVLRLHLGIDEEQLPDVLAKICPTQANVKNVLIDTLEKECSIRVANKRDANELHSVVRALLDGEFDCFVFLTENEFFFAYNLIEEAFQRATAEDKAWFADYTPMLQQYTGQTTVSIQPDAWEKYMTLANDFYYVKTAYSELLNIVSLTDAQKERIRHILKRPKVDESVVARIVNKLQSVSLTQQSFEPEVLCEDIQSICEYQNIIRQAESVYKETAAIVGSQYLMASTDWKIIERNIEFARETVKLFDKAVLADLKSLLINASRLDWEALRETTKRIVNAAQSMPILASLPVQKSAQLLRDNADKLDRVMVQNSGWGELRETAKRIRERVYLDDELAVDADLLELMLGSDSHKLFDVLDLLCRLKQENRNIESYLDAYEEPEQLMDMSIRSLYDRVKACIAHFAEYDTMVEYQVCAEHCREAGLNAFIVKAYPVHQKGTLGKMFEKAFLTAWIDMVSESRESISAFSSRAHTNKIDAFAKLDRKQLTIARERVYAIAHERMPSRNTGKVVGEMGILLREISKSRNGMTIRQLFDSVPNLLTKLKPCLMMSPLSVAYFLKAELYCFDTVIFDEASQIFPENAISAILRGKQVIIAGDSKQMPPTGFFQSAVGTYEEDTEENVATNSDSILEEAENVLPNLSLTWHYRSHNESLITFSNRNMYAGSLVTFPNNAPNTADTGVEYAYVEDGIYEERCNEAEANACVALTIEHFHKYPERSIGIIAFSISQEECIERAFEEFRSQNTQYEHFFRESKENPFFIKNLENVQGDERDTILLSVGYGKNAQGILRYNFGPLGKQGGERRMNVAITRAKYNIKLVTSLRPEDFDKARVETNAGAKLLYDYIRYAKYGPEADAATAVQISEDGFKRYIVKVLQDAGYKTALNIGNSGYKVEIAVEDPENQGSYIVGIETDGQEYSQVRTARDRECLRPDMLSVMGWKMYRVWSTQWIRNPEVERKKLLDFIAARAPKDKCTGGDPCGVEEAAAKEATNPKEESADA